MTGPGHSGGRVADTPTRLFWIAENDGRCRRETLGALSGINVTFLIVFSEKSKKCQKK